MTTTTTRGCTESDCPGHARPGFVRRHVRVLSVLLAGVVAQLALVAAFTSALGDPGLHDATIGLVTSTAGPSVTASFAQPPGTPPADAGIDFLPLASPADAEAAIRSRTVPAALVLDQQQGTLLVAGAAGPSLVAAISQVVEQRAAAAGVTVTVTDIEPLPAHDPHGLDTFLLAIGWVIGGYLGMMLLSRALAGAMGSAAGAVRLLGWTAGYAVASAVLGVVLVDPVLGVVTGDPWVLILTGALIVFAVASFTAALLSLLGLPGLIVAIGSLVVLGNPTSGGSVPDQMLSGGWRFLARILPTNAGVDLVRSTTYFGGQQIGRPLVVLGIYAVASVVLLTVLARRRGAAPRSVTPVAPSARVEVLA